MMNIQSLGLKEGLGVKLRDAICAELCLKFCFVILLSQDGFESDFPERKLQFEKVTVQKSIAELWTIISNQTSKYQSPHTWFDQISDHKHDIYLDGKLSTKLLALADNKNTKFLFTKTGLLLFFVSLVSEVVSDYLGKNSRQTLP